MNTIIRRITSNEDDNRRIISEAATILRNGGLVAFPTETVYGLGGDAFDSHAASAIYAAKGRPSDNPLIVHISEVSDLTKLSDHIPNSAYLLADKFWPGPLTIIVKKNERVPLTITGGLSTVAVRLPEHPVARAIIKESGTFIAAPSANLSGRPSPTSGNHVIEDLNSRIDMIVDGGSINIGLESTIIDLTEDIPVVLRPGFITIEMLAQVLGEVRLDPALMTGVASDIAPKAPGMKYRHYAPRAELTIINGDSIKVIAKMKELAKDHLSNGQKVGIMVTSDYISEFPGTYVINLGSSDNIQEIASNLFGALREFDDQDVDIIYSEGFNEEGIGHAIMNRLLKAAGHKTINL